VVHAYAQGCAYSRQTMPVLDRLARRYPAVKFAQIDVNRNPGFSAGFAIQGTPTLLFFKNGRLVSNQTGALPEAEIDRLLKSLL
jgi:thioredoxin-like negative regulator of GroEL